MIGQLVAIVEGVEMAALDDRPMQKGDEGEILRLFLLAVAEMVENGQTEAHEPGNPRRHRGRQIPATDFPPPMRLRAWFPMVARPA